MEARTARWLPCLALALTACSGESGNGPASSEVPEAPAAVIDPAAERLGTVRFPVSCDEAAARHAQRGLALLHHMTYEDAREAFVAAAEADPECAMGYWGQAMTFIHPLWSDPPSEADFELARALLGEAAGRGEKSDWESAYVEATQGYFAGGWDRDERRNLAAFKAGWERVHAAFPDDPEAAGLYALSLLATADPADRTYAQQLRAGTLAESVLARIPDHPAGYHYTIHAYDYPPLAERALAAAQAYGLIAPEVPHALHMPSHIFTRLGRWPEVIEWNDRSAAAAYARPVAHGISMHYFHALDYVAYAHLQQGQDAEAAEVRRQVEGFDGTAHVHLATAYTLAAVPARTALERQRWEEAAALELGGPETFPWESFPQAEAITQMARALGAARSGEVETARQALERLAVLREATAATSAYWAGQIEIQEHVARAWLLEAEGRSQEGLAEMQRAAELEAATDKHPVTPGEVLPASELLGEMLLAADRPAEALAAYETALARSPNRLNGLYGAGRAAELAGDAEKAERYYTALLALTEPADTELEQRRHATAYLAAS
jgi:tetratricopeptide (TPR) repeat protein